MFLIRISRIFWGWAQWLPIVHLVLLYPATPWPASTFAWMNMYIVCRPFDFQHHQHPPPWNHRLRQPRHFWGDQNAGGTKNLAPERAERAKYVQLYRDWKMILSRATIVNFDVTGGNKNHIKHGTIFIQIFQWRMWTQKSSYLLTFLKASSPTNPSPHHPSFADQCVVAGRQV